MNIEFVKYGLANRFPDHIELNQNLQKYPSLLRRILKHEEGHTSKGFTWWDFKHDINDDHVGQFELLKFMLKHPSSLTQLFPFYWTKRYGFVYDINMTLIYAGLLSIIGVGLFLGYKFI